MRRLAPILLALALLFVPHAARAARLTGVPVRVHAGSWLEIGWAELPGSLYEVELEASVNGGPWRRASAEHEATAGHLTWRVPDHAGRVRLRLRAGGDVDERVVAETPEFWIEPGTTPALPDDDAWWGRMHGDAGEPGAMSSSARLQADEGAAAEGEAPAPLAGPARPESPSTDAHDAAARRVPSSTSTSLSTPVFRPLRN